MPGSGWRHKPHCPMPRVLPWKAGASGELGSPGLILLTVRSLSTPPRLFSMQVYTVLPAGGTRCPPALPSTGGHQHLSQFLNKPITTTAPGCTVPYPGMGARLFPLRVASCNRTKAGLGPHCVLWFRMPHAQQGGPAVPGALLTSALNSQLAALVASGPTR